MDSRVYRVEFDDGNVCELPANVIAESMYASCDANGNKYILFDSFINYKNNLKAVTNGNQQIVHNGRNSLCRSTVGWHLFVKWKDGSTSWQSLKDLKQAYPVAVAEYTVMRHIAALKIPSLCVFLRKQVLRFFTNRIMCSCLRNT